MKTSTRTALAVTGAVAAAALVAGIAPGVLSGAAVNADMASSSSGAKKAPNPNQSTVGFDYWNASAETFRYISRTGEAAAPPTGDFLPGTKQNLEVPYNFIHDYDSTVTWAIFARLTSSSRLLTSSSRLARSLFSPSLSLSASSV